MSIEVNYAPGDTADELAAKIAQAMRRSQRFWRTKTAFLFEVAPRDYVAVSRASSLGAILRKANTVTFSEPVPSALWDATISVVFDDLLWMVPSIQERPGYKPPVRS